MSLEILDDLPEREGEDFIFAEKSGQILEKNYSTILLNLIEILDFLEVEVLRYETVYNIKDKNFKSRKRES